MVLAKPAIFLVIGVLLNKLNLLQVDGKVLRKSLITLSYMVLLPAYTLVATWSLSLNPGLLNILLLIVLTTLIILGFTFLLLRFNKKLPSKVKGALLLSSCFGGVMYFGMPISGVLVGGWTTRISLEYLVISNLILMYVIGLPAARYLTAGGKHSFIRYMPDVGKCLYSDPVLIAFFLGILLNVSQVAQPDFVKELHGTVAGVLVPIMLVVVGLTLDWKSSWNKALLKIWYFPLIKVVLTPLVLFGLAFLIDNSGPKTTNSLLLHAIAPSFVWGYVLCEKYELSPSTYNVIVAASTIFAILGVAIIAFFVL
ncbi:MAG: AEC family transporter [Gammaproteobacteria bacterium]|nr:AEC family transporter [Gammaproteobacteria bacterium]